MRTLRSRWWVTLYNRIEVCKERPEEFEGHQLIKVSVYSTSADVSATYSTAERLLLRSCSW